MKESEKKRALIAWFDDLAPQRKKWLAKNAFFYEDDLQYLRFLIPEGKRVLELGCGTGSLLRGLNPSHGVGVDFSIEMIRTARADHPDLVFVCADMEHEEALHRLDGPFDFIILSDVTGVMEDVAATLTALHSLCTPETRLVITHFNQYWEPILRLGSKIGLRMPSKTENWMTSSQIMNFLFLADFELVRREWRQLLPLRWMGLGRLCNRYLGTLPLLRHLCLRRIFVARPVSKGLAVAPSVTIVIPCRNEFGNIEAAVRRIPPFCDDMELIFVEGHSRDGTFEEIGRVIHAFPERDIKRFKQLGTDKGDAVRLGFHHARGELLMILDADLTVPPEDLPKFYQAVVQGKGEFVNGTRLIYPLENEAMRTLNLWANMIFSRLFSWLLNQPISDTLCGTKVLFKRDYEQIAANRAYFGDFDPFGDFDLLFGAAKANLKIIEVPIRYRARAYGQTQISRFTHGWLLLRMVVFAFKKLKSF
ncbi:MAG: methyltransferase domain-containing protein [Magnetococcales bacterium]|nr:methyltransferase domain-containing protein [Magnetococcales bacterium]MBF0148727.1 methyltransferase domain-containing protein [Magnetococcales bacterium]MBF0630276.1 methyltransferase domain-containing protein [Magnetococcales bacterium]